MSNSISWLKFLFVMFLLPLALYQGQSVAAHGSEASTILRLAEEMDRGSYREMKTYVPTPIYLDMYAREYPETFAKISTEEGRMALVKLIFMFRNFVGADTREIQRYLSQTLIPALSMCGSQL